MNNNDENIKVMIDFGLTKTQARSYLALLDLGTASVKEVAKFSSVARPDTYRALADLQDLGLVEKIVTFPTRFKPLPVADAVSMLILRRNKETVELSKRGNTLIELLKGKNLNVKHPEDGQLTLILGGAAITAKLQKILERATGEFSVLCPRKKFLQCKQFISEILQESLRKKVTVQLITENSAGPLEAREIHELRKNPSFQVKYIHAVPQVSFAVFDKKEIILETTPQREYSESSVLWSNNPSLLELALSYFEKLWNQP